MKNKQVQALETSSDTAEMIHERARPWQVIATGQNLSSLDRGALFKLAQIFDLMPAVPFLTVETTQGPVVVSRDFPSDTLDDINRLLEAIYEDNSQIAAIVFPESPDRSAHRTTAERPSAFDFDTNEPKQDS